MLRSKHYLFGMCLPGALQHTTDNNGFREKNPPWEEYINLWPTPRVSLCVHRSLALLNYYHQKIYYNNDKRSFVTGCQELRKKMRPNKLSFSRRASQFFNSPSDRDSLLKIYNLIISPQNWCSCWIYSSVINSKRPLITRLDFSAFHGRCFRHRETLLAAQILF
jgi:hypothetical protein